jgi:hypothetical protein
MLPFFIQVTNSCSGFMTCRFDKETWNGKPSSLCQAFRGDNVPDVSIMLYGFSSNIYLNAMEESIHHNYSDSVFY